MSFRNMGLLCLQTLGIVIGSVIGFHSHSAAQVTPDGTLPNNSNVNLVDKTFNITGGSQAGGNLYHSFKEFSIPNGSEAFFNNGADIQNIISRVTGKSISEIDGLIKANSTANLFLINPSGIVFGENAQLDIGGSFIGTSANSMKFADGSEFSAIPTNSATPLLTIDVPIGLQFGNPGNINLQGSKLEVNSGKTLALIGGNLIMNKGELIAKGGRIELGGVTETGTVKINTDTNDASFNSFTLDYPVEIQRGDLSIVSGVITVASDGDGSISLNARNIDISEAGKVSGGFQKGLGRVDAIAGDINVNVTENITLSGRSLIESVIQSEATGNAGDINVQAGSLNLLRGSQLFSSTAGNGNSGDINVNVQEEVVFDSAGNAPSTSGIISSVDVTGLGNGGDVTIDASSVLIKNGAQLNVLTNGKGNAGNVTINARDNIITDGSNLGASGILTSVGDKGIGEGGDVNLTATSLFVTNGGQLNALSRNQGSAGNITINVRDRILLSGENQNNAAASAVFTTIDQTGEGSGGKISIFTDSLSITKGAGLYTLTSGNGDAGDIFIEAKNNLLIDGVNSAGGVSGLYTSVTPTGIGNAGQIEISTGSLTITGGAALNTLTKGQGSAGNVYIKARDKIFFDGINENGGASGIYTTVDETAVGNGGDINIETGSLSITGGAGLFALTKSQGNSGNVSINARNTVSFDGTNRNKGSSGIFSSVDRTDNSIGVGKGGNISIRANSFSLSNGGGLFALTRGQGDAGNININARQKIFLDGVNSLSGGASGIYSIVEPEGVGNGKEIRITTEKLSVTNGATLSSTSEGDGAAGNINIDARSIGLNRAIVSSDTVNQEGNINLQATDLILRDRSNIRTNARGENVIGGNININADVIAGFENSDITANSVDFRGGNVKIDTKGIFGIQFRDIASLLTSDITATGANSELSGNVEITTPDVDPTSGLVELPVNLIDASNQISNACTPGSREFQNTFVSTGRGGLPISPTEPLQENNTISAWVRLKPQPENSANTIKPTETNVSNENTVTHPSQITNQIVEATNWIVDNNGNIELVAQGNNPSSKSPWQTSASCSVSR